MVGKKRKDSRRVVIKDFRLRDPEYDEAYLRLLSQVLEGYHSLDVLLRLFPSSISYHSGPFRYSKGGESPDAEPFDQPLERLNYQATVETDLREGDIEQHALFLHEFAQSYVDALVPQFFRKLSEVAGETGQHVGAKGQPFTVDRLLDAIEKCAFDFQNGELPSIHLYRHPKIDVSSCMVFAVSASALVFIHPEKAARVEPAEWSPQHHERYVEIMRKKKAEYDAAKRTRRLS